VPTKEEYCYKILNAYGLIVDFNGVAQRQNVPAPRDGENFAQWKTRVLGSNVNNVVVYAPTTPKGNKKIQNLQAEACAPHLEKTFRILKKTLTAKKAVEVSAAKEDAARQFSSFPKETLQSLTDEYHDTLEPSVREFFQNFLKSVSADVDTETLIREMLIRYNAAVRSYREPKA